eukprot:14214192-Alexandrium_andersonii.AAC.1
MPSASPASGVQAFGVSREGQPSPSLPHTPCAPSRAGTAPVERLQSPEPALLQQSAPPSRSEPPSAAPLPAIAGGGDSETDR